MAAPAAPTLDAGEAVRPARAFSRDRRQAVTERVLERISGQTASFTVFQNAKPGQLREYSGIGRRRHQRRRRDGSESDATRLSHWAAHQARAMQCAAQAVRPCVFPRGSARDPASFALTGVPEKNLSGLASFCRSSGHPAACSLKMVGRLVLGIERVEILNKTLVGRDPRIDRAADPASSWC